MSEFEDQDDELLQIYFEESCEQLDGIETDLLAIEEAGAEIDDDLVNKVFRAVHSVKGGAGFFNLISVRELAHAMENVLGEIRAHEIVPNGTIIGALLAGADALNRMFEGDGTGESEDIAGMIAGIEQSTGAVAEAPPEPEPEPAPELSATGPLRVQDPDDGEQLFEVPRNVWQAVQRDLAGDAKLYLLALDAFEDLNDGPQFIDQFFGEVTDVCTVLATRALPNPAIDVREAESLHALKIRMLVGTIDSPDNLAEALGLPVKCVVSNPTQTVPASKPAAPIDAIAAPEAEAAAPPPPAAPKARVVDITKNKPKVKPAATAAKKADRADNTSIRVRLPLLDRLMTLAGELVLTRNQLVQSVGTNETQALEASQRIDHITTELQDAIMSTRMQSVGTVFNKFKRIVRDLSKQVGKEVELIIEGEDVELDRTVIESIGDPLTHLVRNALDHGLETPEERQAAGKPRRGTLRLSAAHKAGSVLIEIQDDGRGINVERVRAKALERGLFGVEELAVMNRQSILRLIMRPGFSTAAQVTDLSGRGVGMDVVASNMKRLGGSIDLESEDGQGSTMRVKLPLTLAIIPALLVTEQLRRFAIPQANLVELHRIPAHQISERIRVLGDSEMLTLRGSLLPIMRLRDILGMPDRTFVDEEGQRHPDRRKHIGDHRHLTGFDSDRAISQRSSVSSAVHVAVVAAGDFRYGIALESWQETSEIVVKPLGRHLRDSPAYAGATILGDGASALILDVVGIGRQVMRDLGVDESEASRVAASKSKEFRDALSVLLLRGFDSDLFAIPLELVTRVERIDPDRIQNVMNTLSLRYHGGSLPLVPVDRLTHAPVHIDRAGYVVVFQSQGFEVGLFAADLLDVVETSGQIDDQTMRGPGIFGSFHMGEELVLLLDVQQIAGSALNQEPHTVSTDHQGASILLVEPSGFFKRTLTGYLESVGFIVYSVNTPADALDTLQAAERPIHAMVLDVDEDENGGFDLVKRVAHELEIDLPVVITTTSSRSDLLRRGEDAGVSAFAPKLDQQRIAQLLQKLLRARESGRRQAG